MFYQLLLIQNSKLYNSFQCSTMPNTKTRKMLSKNFMVRSGKQPMIAGWILAKVKVIASLI